MSKNHKGSDVIAIVEDERAQRALLERWLETAGYEVRGFASGEEFLEQLAVMMPSAVCLDLHLPGLDGIEVLKKIQRLTPHLPVVFLSSDNEIDNVVAAVKRGAFDYLVKPVDRAKLLTEIRNAVDYGRMALRVAQLEREVEGRGYSGILGQSSEMSSMFRQMDRVANCDITILIRGESGTGKELVSRAIHDASGRRSGPFVAINCAAIPEGLLESELFGHEKGSFTGASQRQIGRIAQADQGTLFLDEVAELSQPLQAKLLRVLQERSFRPVGSAHEIESNFRLITASHRDLEKEVQEGRFREDLFFRIAVFELRIPPLRDRSDDVLLLANYFLQQFAADQTSVPTFDADAERILTSYSWPGNVREVENTVQHALVLCDGLVIGVADLPPRITEGAAEGRLTKVAEQDDDAAPIVVETPDRSDTADASIVPLEELERASIEQALRSTGGNLSEASRLLGIGRSTLYRKITQYGLDTGAGRDEPGS